MSWASRSHAHKVQKHNQLPKLVLGDSYFGVSSLNSSNLKGVQLDHGKSYGRRLKLPGVPACFYVAHTKMCKETQPRAS
eukprot:3565565-Amphidinium_carterae.2